MINKRYKILALGFLPKWRGGLQETGLATGIFDLHNAVNSLDSEYEVVIAATDLFKEEDFIDKTKVIGWNKRIIINHAIRHFYRIPFFILRVIKLQKYYPVFPFLRELIKLLFLDYAIEREMPDIIHLHGCMYATYMNAIWNKNIPTVLRIHGLNGFNETYPLMLKYREIEKKVTSNKFKWVTFLTLSNKTEWQEKYGVFSCPSYCFLNGYNKDIFCSSPNVEKKIDLITIAGVSENKGQRRVMEALSKLMKEGKRMSYLVVGGGDNDYLKNLKEYAVSNQIDVEWRSYCPQNELPLLIQSSKYFIMPSHTEGFGKVFVESIACGTPVILPKNLPISKEKNILNNNNSIFLADDTTESIYNVLSKLYLTSYSFVSTDVSKTIDHLSWSNIAKEYH